MKKVVLTLLIVLILAICLNSASAMVDEFPHMDLLITNYKNVESVTFVAQDKLGNENIEIHDFIRLTEKTKVPFQRIVNHYAYYNDVEYEDCENWSFKILVTMKDGNEYISESMEFNRLFEFTDYVFNVSRGKFIDRRIWSRYPDSFDVFALSVLLVLLGIAVLGVKSIIGAIIKIKPGEKLIVSALLSSLISAVAILLCYVFIPVNIHLLIIGVIIGTGFFEYKYLKKICNETTITRIAIYVIAANTLVIAGVIYIIIELFYGVFI